MHTIELPADSCKTIPFTSRTTELLTRAYFAVKPTYSTPDASGYVFLDTAIPTEGAVTNPGSGIVAFEFYIDEDTLDSIPVDTECFWSVKIIESDGRCYSPYPDGRGSFFVRKPGIDATT
jgi:hypothetical protein